LLPDTAFACLVEEDGRLIKLFYGLSVEESWTLAELAARFGGSPDRIRVRLGRSIDQLLGAVTAPTMRRP
jgi:hypothetical protein